jgi:hypothetical protein
MYKSGSTWYGYLMVTDYETALRLWGEKRLRANYWNDIPEDAEIYDVGVEMEFDEGYDCCGGTDPLCYCSLAESPRADVVITGKYKKTHYGAEKEFVAVDKRSADDFDFVTVLNEILEAGGGTITNEEG